MVGFEVCAIVRHPLLDLPQQAAALLSAGTLLLCQYCAGRVFGLLSKQRLVLPGDNPTNASIAVWLLAAGLMLGLLPLRGVHQSIRACF